MLFTLDRGLLRKGLDDCNEILETTNKVCSDFELTEIKMLGMVDKSRRMRRAYLKSQEVMESVNDTTLPLEFTLQKAQGIYDIINETDEYVTSLIQCVRVKKINIGEAPKEDAEISIDELYQKEKDGSIEDEKQNNETAKA